MENPYTLDMGSIIVIVHYNINFINKAVNRCLKSVGDLQIELFQNVYSFNTSPGTY